MGRVAEETSTLGPTKSDTYDETSQLTGDGADSWSWDANGNQSGHSIGLGNQLESDGVWNYAYDLEGNTISRTNIATGEVWLYAYDGDNRLVKAEHKADSESAVDLRVEFVYDILGNRIQKSVDPDGDGEDAATVLKMAYDPDGNAWLDFTGSSSLITRRLYGDATDDMLARIDAEGTVNWYLADNLGSIRDIAGVDGSLLVHADYSSFGSLAYESTGGILDRYGFQSRERDDETGMGYFRARYVFLDVGRWNSPDPLGFGAGDANLYRFVGNNPANATDPSGLAPPDPSAHLPAEARGRWSGEAGNSDFIPNNPDYYGIGGTRVLSGEVRIPFRNNRPVLDSFAVETHEVLGLNGSSDRPAMLRALAEAKGMTQAEVRRWLNLNGYRLHHAGGNRIQLIPEILHDRLHHTGGAFDLRAGTSARPVQGQPVAPTTQGGASPAMRPAGTGASGSSSRRAGRTSARAVNALAAYLTIRDACQGLGIIQPDRTISQGDYYFTAEDGSVFVVQVPGSLNFWSNPRRAYVAGPRQGQTEDITQAQVDAHRTAAEALYGRYIPGGFFWWQEGPRFIRGTRRQSLPITDFMGREIGYIDERGEHMYSPLQMGPPIS